MSNFEISGSVIESKQDTSIGKVTIITPTTADRDEFNQRIRQIVKSQDYDGEIEHLIGFGKASIGIKRNELCSRATGDIILHFDSDDLYAPDWISRSVKALTDSKAELTGLSSCYFYDISGKLYEYKWTGGQPYICEATMCYWRKAWDRVKFANTSDGEGKVFCANTRVKAHGYKEGFAAIRHGKNTISNIIFGIKEMALIHRQVPLIEKYYPTPARQPATP